MHSIAVVVSSCLQAIPLAYVGGFLHNLKDYTGDVTDDPASMATLIIGGTATVAGAAFIMFFTKKKLDQLLLEEKQKEKAGEIGLVVVSAGTNNTSDALAVRGNGDEEEANL